MVEEQTEEVLKKGKESADIEPQSEFKQSSNDNHSDVQITDENIIAGESPEMHIQNKRQKNNADESKLFLRRERDKRRQRLARQNEDDAKRKLRLEKDRLRKRRSRQLEDDFEKLRRRDKDRERRALKRKIEKEKLQEKNFVDNGINERVSMVNIKSIITTKNCHLDTIKVTGKEDSCIRFNEEDIRTEKHDDKTSEDKQSNNEKTEVNVKDEK